MDKLETEKRSLQIKLDQPVSDPTTLKDINNGDTATNLSSHIQHLRSEVLRLRSNLAAAQKETNQKMQQFAQEEKTIREENIRLQRKLQAEVERREALCRHLSESESSLEMDEERFYNENFNLANHRQRTISSPVPNSPSNSRPLSPGASTTNRCYSCGQFVVSINLCISNKKFNIIQYFNASSLHIHHFDCYFAFLFFLFFSQGRRTSERFVKPAVPTQSLCLNSSAPNVMSHQGSGILGAAINSVNSNVHHTLNPLNSSLSSGSSITLPTNISNPSISFASNSALTQPASPMDTSAYKE